MTELHYDKHVQTAALEQLSTYIQSCCNDFILESKIERNELTITARRAEIIKFLRFLRDDKQCQFKQLIDLCGVDWLGKEERVQDNKRFDVVYHLLSISRNQRLRVKVRVGENQSVDSCVGVFSAANWYERECYDMYGIPFDGHPDLRRLLTDYDFDGFPLRKDFPLEGKVEVYYDETEKRVAYKPVDLPQEFRRFDQQSPWQAMTGNAHLAEADNTFSSDEFTAQEKEAS